MNRTDKLTRREFAALSGALGAAAIVPGALAQTETERVDIDVRKVSGSLNHIWSETMGSDRAAITLREAWRKDLERCKNEIGLKRVRFHGIFNDELGVGFNGNFQNVNAVYDGLLDRGVQPFVELSFMPRSIASGTKEFGFYRANVTPPKSMENWTGLVDKFVRNLIQRYGAAEVRQWYFEVWNEPNLNPPFWTGTQEDYFALYKATAATVKSVDPSLRTGGPASSAVQWLPQFLDYCARNDAPVDFVSTHIYPGDDQAMIFGQANKFKQYDVVPAAVAQARAQIDASRFKGTELWLNEWSSDSPAMIAHAIVNSLPHCQAMGQWQISGEYEEIMVAPWIFKEGQNGWGILARGSVAKPEFNTYKLLNRLGNRRLAATGPALASQRDGGGFAALVWNLADVQQAPGIPGASSKRLVLGTRKVITVRLRGAQPGQQVKVSYVDLERGSPYPIWRSMGSPKYPTREQMDMIRKAAEIAAPENRTLNARAELQLDLPAEGVALVESA
ncbi:xylan 1,4-beta-xylosidase [Sphingobium sp. OAS761]|uniref:GH39 family glycosyl hydrolase n=1 Tax=Sphingobium sp. OAS761 TaxID=2817901 RepID=UPI0020A21083|nr:glycosyl hydrolase [Sphingobium sp. OAS761]MCP1468985.1 xylan 1,4-beta-xylosidase [Sphingobium sp. OAS761]